MGKWLQWLRDTNWRQRGTTIPAHLQRCLPDSGLRFGDASYFCGHCRDERNFAAESVVATTVGASDEVAGPTGVAADTAKDALVAAVAKLELDLKNKIGELNLYRRRKAQDAERVQIRKRASEAQRQRAAKEASDREEVRGRGRPIPPRDSIARC